MRSSWQFLTLCGERTRTRTCKLVLEDPEGQGQQHCCYVYTSLTWVELSMCVHCRYLCWRRSDRSLGRGLVDCDWQFMVRTSTLDRVVTSRRRLVHVTLSGTAKSVLTVALYAWCPKYWAADSVLCNTELASICSWCFPSWFVIH